MSEFPARILLATDGSGDAMLAARAAAGLSAAGSELHVVHARSNPEFYVHHASVAEQYLEVERKEGHRLLEEQVLRLEESGAAVTDTHLRIGGRASGEILAAADDLDAGLLVLGSRGLGKIKRLVLGSVSEDVVHHARCPVLVMRGGESAWPPARVVIGDDGSEAAAACGELAAGLGRLAGARATLVRAFPDLPQVNEIERRLDPRNVEDEERRHQRLLEERADALEDTLGGRPRIRIATGDAAEVMLDTAAGEEPPESALIAVGSRGLGAAGRMRFGSVSTRLVRAAEGPVLIHPEPE